MSPSTFGPLLCHGYWPRIGHVYWYITPLSVKKAESIQAVWTSFDMIVDVLQKITDGNEADRQTQTQALGLRKRMLSLDFIVAIMFMKNIAYKTKSLVVHLQTVELNILDASGLVEAIPYASWRKFERTTTWWTTNRIIHNGFARRLGIDPEDDFNRHHRPRRAPRRVDEQAGTAAVLSLQQLYRKQLREVLDVLTSSMSEHLVQCKESLLPLLKCLQPQIDSSCIHSAVSLFPPASQPPDPLALEAELQVLSELLPTDVGKARLQQGSWTQWGQQINTSAGKLGSPLDAYSSCITVASNEVLLAYWSL